MTSFYVIDGVITCGQTYIHTSDSPELLRRMHQLVLFVALVVSVADTSAAANFGPMQKWLSDRLSKVGEYDKRERPNSNETLIINLNIYVNSIRSIQEETMSYMLEIYFRQSWQDSRLAFNSSQFGLADNDVVNLHNSFEQLLWTPDTFLPNAIKSSIPEPESITHRSLIKLFPSGRVLWSRRLSITAECPMDLSIYPFDTQTCVLSIESYSSVINDLRYQWRLGNAVELSDKLKLPVFAITDVLEKERIIVLATGNYSRLEVCFVFKRISGFYFTQLFIPAAAIVCMAWFSFWVDENSGFGDMVQIILSMTFLYFTYSTMVPKVSYVKAMDVFLAICFIFVFFALVKVVVMKQLSCMIESIEEDEKKRRTKIQHCTSDVNDDGEDVAMTTAGSNSNRQLEHLRKVQHYFRLFGHKFFMLFFLIILVVYLLFVFVIVNVDPMANCRFETQ